MPSKKKKYNARFPPGRIKKIMQTDEEVGKVAQAVPIIISRTLELFVHSLLTKTMEITNNKQAKTLSPSHMKQCILSESRFDFLKDLVRNLPDVNNPDEDNHTSSANSAVGLTNHTVLATVTPKTQATDIVSVTKNDSSSTQISSRRRSSEKGDRSKTVKPVEVHETVFQPNVPNFKISVPPSFNASQPNFYTELNSNSSDNAPKPAVIQPMSNFCRTANIDEDYDT